MVLIKFYALITKNGEYFSLSGQTTDINKAKIYPKIGPARARLTRLINDKYTTDIEYDIIELQVTQTLLLDNERTKSIINTKKRDNVAIKNRIKYYESNLQRLDENIVKNREAIIYNKEVLQNLKNSLNES